MKTNQKRPEFGKMKRFLAAVLSVGMLATTGFTSVLAETETAKLTADYYPGAAGIVQKTNNTDADGFMLCWQAPIVTPESTALYMWDNEAWTEISGATPAGTTVTDINAIYKIVNTFTDGLTSEYIIQKNNSGLTYVNLDNAATYWAGATKRKYVGVTGADYAGTKGGHSLKITNWGKGDDPTYSLLALISQKSFDAEKDYKLTYDWKSTYTTGMPVFFLGKGSIKGNEGSVGTWNKREIVYKNGEIEVDQDLPYNNSSFGILSFIASEVTDSWIDNIEIYELDENGNVTGENLLPYGDFELAPGTTSAPINKLANIRYEGIAGGAMLNWAKPENVIATRVYTDDGILVAELGNATEIPLLGLTDGESYTYELRSVYAGGYESAGKTVTVTAGIPEKPELSEYYPINAFGRYQEFDDGNGGKAKLVKLMWMNPDLNGIDLTSIKIYDISGTAPVEKSTTTAIDLGAGCENEVIIADSTDCQNNFYRLDFAYDDGTTVSFTLKASVITSYNVNERWCCETVNTAHLVFGHETNFSHSGDASLMLHHYRKGLSRLIYDNDTYNAISDKKNSGFTAGAQYEVSFWYKTILGSNKVVAGDQYADFKVLGNDIRIDCNDSYDWTEVKQTITAGADSNIAIYTYADSCNAALWIDDISIRMIDSNTGLATGDNLIENGSFDDVKANSVIYDATYTGIDGGAVINWTRHVNYDRTNVYLDGARIATVYDTPATLPVTGLENGKKYTIALKDVAVSGREYNGAYLTITAGEGNGTDLYAPDGISARTTDVGVNIGWYNPWNELSSVTAYDVTDGKAVELKKAVYLDADGNEAEVGTPDMTLDAGRHNYMTISNSKGFESHLYKLIFTFADGTVREYTTNTMPIDSKYLFSNWETLTPVTDLAHYGYTNDAIGEKAFAFGRYHYTYKGQYPDTGLFYKNLAGKLEVGKTYRVAFKMKGKDMTSGNTIALEGNTLNTAGETISFYAPPSKNWLQFYFDIPVTSLTEKETYIRVNGVPYMMIDDFEIYELDENGIVAGQIDLDDGDFEEKVTVDKVTNIASGSKAGNIELTWTLPENGVGANIYADGKKIASVFGSKVIISGYKPGKEYTFEVRAINKIGYESEGVDITAKADSLIVNSFDIYNMNDEAMTSLELPPEYTVKASLTNYGEQDKNVMIVYAMYYENNSLHSVFSKTDTVKAGDENKEISVEYILEDEFFLPDGVSYAKIFLWDMTDNMKPIGDTKILQNSF